MATPHPIMPGLRAYPCFDTLPAGCFAHVIGEETSETIVRLGEIVVIDPSQREYVDSELFLIEWRSRAPTPRRSLGMPRHRNRLSGDPVDQPTPIYVSTVAPEPICALDGSVMLSMRWADGPYLPEQLENLFLGRVVGILQPTFEETSLRRAN